MNKYVYLGYVYDGLEILLPSSGNVNDYVRHIQRKYADRDRKNKTYREEEVAQYD